MDDYQLKKIGENGDYDILGFVPSALCFNNSADGGGSVGEMYGSNASESFGDISDFISLAPKTIKIKGKEYAYIPYGDDDGMPTAVLDLIGSNLVLDQSLLFDAFTCYAQGIRFVNREDHKDTSDDKIRNFCLRNSLHECFMSQAQSIKYFFFSVTEIILSRDKTEIVKIRNLDSTFCRFQKRNKKGKIEHVLYGDFNSNGTPEDATAIPLLDLIDPLGDLMVRQGREPNPDTGKMEAPEKDTKYAIVCRMPMPGCRYYPNASYFSLFRDDWYDIYKLVGKAKKFRIGNTGGPRYQIEVHKDYWNNICVQEGIKDPEKMQERIDKEYRDLKSFVTGPQNAGKAMISNYYIDPNGKEVRMVRINYLDTKKEGGDYSEDMGEATNSVCYAVGVHPSLAGATPGKSQMNNSGSDKRELFNLKQITQKPFHDIMLKPYHVVLHYNGWDDKFTLDVPINQLTTLDENKSNKKVTTNNTNTEEE